LLAGIGVQVGERFDVDTPAVECRNIKKRATTRKAGSILHEFKVIDLLGCPWRTANRAINNPLQ
jgi:hypothetical protein